MGKESRIEWTDHTVNFWFGCTKLTAACDNCYAEGWAKRSGMVEWGPGLPRRKSVSAVKMALKLDREAAAAGERRKVFCNSLSDFFDAEVNPAQRAEAWDTIRCTPNLDWLILTKRHHIAVNNLPERPMPNVRIGFTVENEKTASMRLPDLATIAMTGWKTFISYEPALGPVNWCWWFLQGPGLFQWLICGGESGGHARPMHPDWARGARDACQAAGVPFFFKQWGEWTPGENVNRQRGLCDVAWFGEKWTLGKENLACTDGHVDDQPDVYRVGKKAAGSLLDGRAHKEFPR